MMARSIGARVSKRAEAWNSANSVGIKGKQAHILHTNQVGRVVRWVRVSSPGATSEPRLPVPVLRTRLRYAGRITGDRFECGRSPADLLSAVSVQLRPRPRTPERPARSE